MKYYLCKISDLDCYKIDEETNEIIIFNPNLEIDDNYLLLQKKDSPQAFDFYTGATVMVTDDSVEFIEETVKEYEWYCYSPFFISEDKLIKYDSTKKEHKDITNLSDENMKSMRDRMEELRIESGDAVKVISENLKNKKTTIVKKIVL